MLVDIAPRIEPEGAQRITSFMIGRPDGYASLEEVADAIAEYTRHRSRPRDLESLKKNLRLGENGRWHWHWDPRFMGADGPAEIVDRKRLFAAARRLAFPTLLVRGRDSDILSDEGVREFLSHLPNAQYVDVGGAGHMVAGDRNDAFTEAVRSFLARVAPVFRPPAMRTRTLAGPSVAHLRARVQRGDRAAAAAAGLLAVRAEAIDAREHGGGRRIAGAWFATTRDVIPRRDLPSGCARRPTRGVARRRPAARSARPRRRLHGPVQPSQRAGRRAALPPARGTATR